MMNPEAKEWKPNIDATAFVPSSNRTEPVSDNDYDGNNLPMIENIGVDGDDLLALADENEDWMATSIIYEGTNKSVKPIHQINTSAGGGQGNNTAKGFIGSIDIPISFKNIIFFRKVSKEGHYRYFSFTESDDITSIKQEHPSTTSSAILQLDFVYDYGNDNIDSDVGSVLPSSVNISWKKRAKGFFLEDNNDHQVGTEFLDFLKTKCNGRLSSSTTNHDDIDEAEASSFGICNYCEHEALTEYFGTKSLFYEDGQYQLIQLPERQDHLYHHNIGRMIHPKDVARQEKRQLRQRKQQRQRQRGRKQSKLSKQEPESPNLNSSDNNKANSHALSTNHRSNNSVNQQNKLVTIPTTPTVEVKPETMSLSQPPQTPDEFAERTLVEQWERLYQTSCPICMDENLYYCDGVTLPSCQHFVCEDCFDMYLRHTIHNDLFHSTKNPFCCPIETCRKSIPIFGKKFLKQYLSESDMDRVHKWYKDLKNPPCFSLDQCLSPNCQAKNSMRRKPPIVDSSKCKDTDIYCDACERMWCELCLKRLYYSEDDSSDNINGFLSTKIDDGVNSNKTCRGQLRHKGDENICDPSMAIMFCQRFLAASTVKKEQCIAKYPWISSYAESRDLDLEANKWVTENGQICPTCSSGVERSGGCFHMQCAHCQTHFCYECGDQLFPPYYGTHHCWEEQNQVLGIR